MRLLLLLSALLTAFVGNGPGSHVPAARAQQVALAGATTVDHAPGAAVSRPVAALPRPIDLNPIEVSFDLPAVAVPIYGERLRL